MPRRSTASRDHDGGYRLLFSHPRLVQDLVTGYVDPSVARMCDFSTLERCAGSYVGRSLRQRHSDVVWRLKTTAGWAYLYILVEFQSSNDRYMAVRLLSYLTLLWQDLIRRKEVTEDGRLPAVLPIVLYNGDEPWTAPISLRALITPSIAAVDRHQPDFTYLFLDENHLPVHGRAYLRNVMAGIAALEQNPSLEQQRVILANFSRYIGEDSELSLVVRQWVSEVLLDDGGRRSPPPPETFQELNTMIITKLKQERERERQRWEREYVAQGRAEGKAEGKAEGLIAAILTLVEDGDIPASRAMTRLEHLAEQHLIAPAQLRKALAQLRKRR